MHILFLPCSKTGHSYLLLFHHVQPCALQTHATPFSQKKKRSSALVNKLQRIQGKCFYLLWRQGLVPPLLTRLWWHPQCKHRTDQPGWGGRWHCQPGTTHALAAKEQRERSDHFLKQNTSPRGSICSCFQYNHLHINNINAYQKVLWILWSLGHLNCQWLFGIEQKYFMFPCSGIHVWLLSTPKPEALEEKGISIATVCPRQKTPQKNSSQQKNPTRTSWFTCRDRPGNAPTDFCAWGLWVCCPKTLVFHLRAAGEHKEEEIISKRFQIANENYLIC